MKAMITKKGWFSSTLEQQEVKVPKIKNNEVMIKVYAVGVNRGDLIKVGACPGLECSGIIESVGRNVDYWKVGDRVCAILEGGGYAEKVAVPADFLLPLPDDIDLADAAGLPYASCSIWIALFKMHDRSALKDKTILIHEGTSAVGALAIKYAKYMGLKVIATTGSSNMVSTCLGYGADYCLDHTLTFFVSKILQKTRLAGVDFVLDYGASNLQRYIECCSFWGKVVLVDLHGKKLTGSIDLCKLERKQVEIKAFDLQSRDLVYKASVIAEVRAHLWPAVLEKRVVPVIEHRFPVNEAQKAWKLFQKNDLIGKIILHMNFDEVLRHLKMD
ncbi:hypothetical protein F511_00482 [Dorcoceras hygrometricum]|uniref:Enoyl reductase (ER) domain-containing protein n=1 Tax=Dorcoceras hygrometricum TaxID=472368 RepID=A0A2Z7BHS4_9LAMI|nr:hypothetical protein F511_00482 [Dorcoceras hygrometricum]